MKLSLQQVHSWKCSQITGKRRLVSIALTTCETPADSRPMKAAIMVQNFTKSLRE
jgi:hypothetical protein